jgi:DNA-binding response OmpR family regulator
MKLMPLAERSPRAVSVNAQLRQTVLIIEDDFLIADFIRCALDDAGYAIAGVASRAAPAMTLAEHSSPKLALVDIRLGPDDGVALGHELAQRHGIPVIFLSGSGDPETRRRANALAGAQFLQKPFRVDQLVRAVRAALPPPPVCAGTVPETTSDTVS